MCGRLRCDCVLYEIYFENVQSSLGSGMGFESEVVWCVRARDCTSHWFSSVLNQGCKQGRAIRNMSGMMDRIGTEMHRVSEQNQGPKECIHRSR